MADEIAYRELKPGEVIQLGDQWQAKYGTGVWHEYHPSQYGLEATEASIARRLYNITQLQKEQREASEVVAIWQRAVHDLATKNQHLTAELARLQQPPPAADHIADASKMPESELERMAWELYSRLDLDEEGAFRQAEHFIAERNRRRKEQENERNRQGRLEEHT